MATILPVSSETGLPLDPSTMQALQMQRMEQGIGMQGGSAATKLNEMGFQQGLSNLFPSPQVQQASQVQNALRQAQLSQNPGESQLDFSIRQLQAQRDAVAQYSPESAAALNTKLVQLANMKFEQQHLVAADQRASSAEDREQTLFNEQQPGIKAENAAGLSTTWRLVQPGVNGKAVGSFDLSSNDGIQQYVAARQKDPSLVSIRDDQYPAYEERMAQARAAEAARLATVAALNKPTDPATPLTNPADERLAQEVATYRLDPKSVPYSRGGNERANIMARATYLNPDYDEAEWSAHSGAAQAWTHGPEAQNLIRIKTAYNHLDTLSGLVADLQNGSLRPGNALYQRYSSMLGRPAPTTFNGVRDLVQNEVVSAASGGGLGRGGAALADREKAALSADYSNSPAQLYDLIGKERTLMQGRAKPTLQVALGAHMQRGYLDAMYGKNFVDGSLNGPGNMGFGGPPAQNPSSAGGLPQGWTVTQH